MDKQKPALVIMAAGMGSRFGGLKQIEPVDPEGHIIIDFSLFDSWRAGFRDVVFIIKREMEAEFRACIGDRMERYFHVSYVYQDLDRLPEGIEIPKGRTKPWGTGHALGHGKRTVCRHQRGRFLWPYGLFGDLQLSGGADRREQVRHGWLPPEKHGDGVRFRGPRRV